MYRPLDKMHKDTPLPSQSLQIKCNHSFDARPRARLYDTDGALIGEVGRNSIAYRLHTRAITALDILDGFENEVAKGTDD